MKVLIVVAVLTTLLLSVDGAPRQCAGTGSDRRYERSGFLTASFTKKACDASRGSIDPNKKGNQKCCNVSDSRQGKFNDACNGQKDAKFSSYKPTAQPC